MPDNLKREQRQRCMSHNRGKDTGPELRLRRALWAAGLRYRLNCPLPGRPDFIFVAPRLAIFIDGCFWHGCTTCRTRPATNQEFWNKKIDATIRRDTETNARLAELGWRVLRLWEHEVCDDLGPVVARIVGLVRSGSAKDIAAPDAIAAH